MKWPWKSDNLEYRADDSFTNALITLLTARAGGQQAALPAAIGALEAASGLIGRAFATAMVETPATAVLGALTPACLALVARSLVRAGEIVLYLDTSAGMIDLLPAQSWDVDGGPNPRTWEYRVTVSGPERTFTYDRVPATGVLHFQWARDAATPWRGVGPLQSGQLTARLAADLMAALADEAATPRGQVMQLPIDGDDPTLINLKASIKNLAGGMAYLEGGDMGGGPGGGVVRMAERIGAQPPAALVELFKLTRLDVLAACGINPSLFDVAPGVAMREAYREFLFSTVSPLGRMVAFECTEKLGAPVTMDWSELRAGDIASHARAFSSMVQGGIPVERAAALSGLLAED